MYAFDSTTIDLCLNVFWWATFRKAKAAVKLHTLYDIKTSIPSFMHIIPGSVHDVNALDVLLYEADGYYTMHRGYVDFERLYFIHQCKAFFITRAKNNFKFKRLYSTKTDKSKGIMCDQTVKLQGYYSLKAYPERYVELNFMMKSKNEPSYLSPTILYYPLLMLLHCTSIASFNSFSQENLYDVSKKTQNV